MDEIRWEKTRDKKRSLKKSRGFGMSGKSQEIDDEMKENIQIKESCLMEPNVQSYPSTTPRRKHRRTASLNELCAEDKKKVANLIQELAHLGSEKEQVEGLLKKERENFETAIVELVSDQKRLLSERQCVQSELVTCQKMLSQLQEVVLNKPQSLSLAEGETRSNTQSSSQRPRAQSDFDRHSALDNYLIKQSNGAEAMELASTSDIGSVISESAHHYPKISSTILSEHSTFLNSSSHTEGGHSIKPLRDNNSTINYSKKEELKDERARLIEEQKALTRKLFEQEEVLRQTQRKLYQTQRENQELHDKSHQLSNSDAFLMPKATYITGPTRHFPTPQSLSNQSDSLPQSLQLKQSGGTSVQTPQPISTGIVDSRESSVPMVERIVTPAPAYSIGVQVSRPGSRFTLTKDTSVQAELPMSAVETKRTPTPPQSTDKALSGFETPGRYYVGNRLVPSPREPRSIDSSFEETMARTSKLLASARKIIDDAKTPSSSSSKSSKGGKVTPTTCRHSFQMVTPHSTCQPPSTLRKTPQELFDLSDATLATDINTDSMHPEKGLESEADKTELELLEDVFYVR